jgi:hypothetical protein
MTWYGGPIEVEGYAKPANRIFPFSKPSPFSSMTDWLLDSQQTMTKPSAQNHNCRRLKTMAKEKALHREVHEEMTKFEKTMEDIRLLKCVSKDLKNYRKMMKLKKYD